MIKKIKTMWTKNKKRCVQKWDINIDELNNKVKNGAVLLDVRSIQEYNEGHLKGAIHLAEYEIQVKHKNILQDKEREIIVYCQNGGRSRRAYKKLRKIGYKHVYNLCGGLDNYR